MSIQTVTAKKNSKIPSHFSTVYVHQSLRSSSTQFLLQKTSVNFSAPCRSILITWAYFNRRIVACVESAVKRGKSAVKRA